VPDVRTAALRRNLATIETRIAAACHVVGRDPSEVILIAVTKTFPADDIRRLVSLGVRDIGENRDQEAAPKAAAVRDLDLRMHFVGQLQVNKCRSVASYATAVHSVDRPRLVRALSAAAEETQRSVDVFIQVTLDDNSGAGGRGGALPAEVPALADMVTAAGGLALIGVMAVAPLCADPVPAFRRLAAVAADVRAAHPDATAISAGMSGDLEVALATGATHVRIGTALLGGRPPVVR
jgi:pyridoxal phosphate enzyme (YggS family)